MKRILAIGIGTGNPDHMTIQAVNALNTVDVFFLLDKGSEKDDFAKLRKDVCERYVKDRSPKWVEIPSPARDASMPSYKDAVHLWHQKKAEIFTSLIRDKLKDGECGAFLVWGDPSLYDSTLRILQQIAAEGLLQFEYEVIPGVSSIQVLAARHKIALNTIGEPVLFTTGRKLAAGLPDNADNVVVFLDNGQGLQAIADKDVDIYWGAYLGSDDEVLISGRLPDVVGDIMRIRRDCAARKKWIMDTYLLRR